MKIRTMAIACVWACLVAAPMLAIGFDPRGAQEAAGLSREFDDATRLKQMQEAPELPPPPVVEEAKPAPPRGWSSENADSAPLVQTQQSDTHSTQPLQQAERDLQHQRRGGFWQTAWRFALWSAIGMALAWAIWSWVVRRASDGLKGV